MKKNIFIIITLLLFVLPASAQVSGGAIKRPSKSHSTNKVAPKPQKKPSTTQNKPINKTQRGSIENSRPRSHDNQEQKISQQEKKKALTGYTNGHAWVDLGLPSGTLWATMNVGATSPEDYGDYFAWGETKGYNFGKTNFTWSTYKWCNGSETTLTKYCTSNNYGYNGFTDNRTYLYPEDDAALVNWGIDWCMPTQKQFEELINSSYTTTEWTTVNGVNGRKITSKTNGNSIFLPAAGCRGTSLYEEVLRGYYWSRTLNSDYPYDAWHLYFDSSRMYICRYYRNYGQGVRPVRVSQ